MRVLQSQGGIKSLTFAPDGRTLLAVSTWALRAWDLDSGRSAVALAVPVEQHGRQHLGRARLTPDGHTLCLSRAHYPPEDPDAPFDDGPFPVPSGTDVILCVPGPFPDQAWPDPGVADLRLAPGWAVRHTLRSAEDDFSFSRDSRWIVTGVRTEPPERAVVLWDVLEGRPGNTLALEGVKLSWPAISPDGRFFTALTFHRENESSRLGRTCLRVSHWPSLEPGPVLELPVVESHSAIGVEDAGPWAAEFAPDGRSLALRGSLTVEIYDTASWQRRASLRTAARTAVKCLAFAPNGSHVLITTSDGIVRLWDVRTGAPRAEWDWRIGQPRDVVFAPDGLSAAAVGDTNKVVIWDLDE